MRDTEVKRQGQFKLSAKSVDRVEPRSSISVVHKTNTNASGTSTEETPTQGVGTNHLAPRKVSASSNKTKEISAVDSN